MPSHRPLRAPLPPGEQKFRSVTLAATGWVRLHWPGRASVFVWDGSHRFTPLGINVLYAATDPATAAREVFGDRIYQKKIADIPGAEWNGKMLSDLILPAVQVADLYTPSGLETAQVDTTALAYNDLTLCQSWAIAAHHAGFHGVLYASRFTKKKCVALFAVPGDPAPTVSGTPRRFRDSPAAQHILTTYVINLT